MILKKGWPSSAAYKLGQTNEFWTNNYLYTLITPSSFDPKQPKTASKGGRDSMSQSQKASANPAEPQPVARSGGEKNGNGRGPQQTGRTSASAQPKQGCV